MQARSSGGERYLDTVEVGGSRPPAPTIKETWCQGIEGFDAFSVSNDWFTGDSRIH